MDTELQDKEYDILRGRVTFSAKSKTALATLLFLSAFKGNEDVYLKIDTAAEALLDSLIAKKNRVKRKRTVVSLTVVPSIFKFQKT